MAFKNVFKKMENKGYDFRRHIYNVNDLKELRHIYGMEIKRRKDKTRKLICSDEQKIKIALNLFQIYYLSHQHIDFVLGFSEIE